MNGTNNDIARLRILRNIRIGGVFSDRIYLTDCERQNGIHTVPIFGRFLRSLSTSPINKPMCMGFACLAYSFILNIESTGRIHVTLSGLVGDVVLALDEVGGLIDQLQDTVDRGVPFAQHRVLVLRWLEI
jgi:hypothetical protein